MTYRAELSARALKQMHGLPGSAFDSLIQVMAEVIEYPDDPLRTFPTGDPYIRRVEFGGAGLITYFRGIHLTGLVQASGAPRPGGRRAVDAGRLPPLTWR